ncbi:B12-binding domain-containing radical SAM protein [bacterium CG_4_9_14_3_um_filter_65_15]|nr:MAG: B12-binding domain-containing radical SAM protein [bacterium CG_4_9_14_3_um_filter_65_15]
MELQAAAPWRPRPCYEDPSALSRALTRRVLPLVGAPGRYVGGELGAERNGFSGTGANILLTFPDAYEVGMSHQGLRILYTLLQRTEGVFCDIAFAPWPDMEERMRAEGLPLFGLESRRAAASFDLVGFSLGYELAYTNMLTMIDLAGSPLASDQRGEEDPIFLAGGSCAINPAVVGPFLDVVFLGDGEEMLPEAAVLVRQAKSEGLGRTGILARLRELPGAWWTGCPGPVLSRAITDMNAYPPPAKLVPVIEPVHDRLSLEVMRGCVRGCRFCQAGMITRPVRERDADKLVAAAREGVAAAGYAEVSLLSLSTADYSGLGDTVAGIQAELAGTRTNLVLPSLRVDSVDADLYERIGRERPRSFTFAPEAGSQRLRDVINKNITEQQILDTAREVFAAGVKSVKLYFMIGLPTETNEDLDALVALVGQVVGLAPRGGDQVHVSLSPFAPKAHTAFQWAGQISREEIRRRNNYLARPLRRMKVKVSLREPEVSFLEALLGLGDERLAPVVAEAWNRGARFDGWDESFDFSRWEAALQSCGIDPEPYLAPRDPGSPLPWDNVDVGVTRSFLQRDWERARREQTLADCRLEIGCYDCGSCSPQLQHLFSLPSGKVTPAAGVEPEGISPDEPPEFDPRNRDPRDPGREQKKWTIWRQQAATKCWYRMEYAKTEDMAFLGHLDFQRQLHLALRRSNLPVAYSKGYHPHPLLKFGPPLPLGHEGLRECMDLALTHACPGWDDDLNRTLPAGLRIGRTLMVGSQNPASIDQVVVRFSYRVEIPGGDEGPDRGQIAAKVGEFLDAPTWPYVRHRPKGDVNMDIRALVPAGALVLEDDPGANGSAVLRLSLLRTRTGAVLPVNEFLAALLGDLLPESRFCRVVRTGYHGRHHEGRWYSPLEEVGESNLRYWLGRHING